MQTIQTKCDNPPCKHTGDPENQNPYMPPYGWADVTVTFVGSGPTLKVEVCGPACIQGAIAEAARKEHEG